MHSCSGSVDFLDFQWTFRIIRISLGFFFELMGFSFGFVSKVYGLFRVIFLTLHDAKLDADGSVSLAFSHYKEVFCHVSIIHRNS